MGFHQGDEGHSDVAQVMGNQDYHLHRRYPNNGGVSSASITTSGGADSHPGMSGIYHQYQEVGSDPHTGNRIPGHDGEFQYLTGQSPSRQKETDLFRGHPDIQYDLAVSSPTVSLSGETQCSNPSCSSSSTLLLQPSAGFTSSNQDYDTLLSLSQASQEELSWWKEQLPKWNGKPLRQSPAQVTISSDTSQLGWGAVCAGTQTGGAWSVQEQSMHINSLELLAATLAVKTFLKDASGISVLLQLDNATAVAYINNMGSTVSSQLTTLAKELWTWTLDKDIGLSAQHIPRVSNTLGIQITLVYRHLQ